MAFLLSLLGWAIVIIYLLAILKIADVFMDEIKKRTDDDFLITLPLCLLLCLSSFCILFIMKLYQLEFASLTHLMTIILYTSVTISSILLFSIIVIRPINKSMYEKVVYFIKYFKFKK